MVTPFMIEKISEVAAKLACGGVLLWFGFRYREKSLSPSDASVRKILKFGGCAWLVGGLVTLAQFIF
jgi:hypothetical protein